MANDSYDLIDRFLRNNLDDADYAEYSKALDGVLASHTGEAEPVAWEVRNAEISYHAVFGTEREAKAIADQHDEEGYSQAVVRALYYATPPAATPAAPGEVTDATIVYAQLTDDARRRTSRENIEDVLAALSNPAPVAAPAPVLCPNGEPWDDNPDGIVPGQDRGPRMNSDTGFWEGAEADQDGSEQPISWKTVANEWAELAVNAGSWVLGLKEGRSTPDNVMGAILEGIQRCEDLCALAASDEEEAKADKAIAAGRTPGDSVPGVSTAALVRALARANSTSTAAPAPASEAVEVARLRAIINDDRQAVADALRGYKGAPQQADDIKRLIERATPGDSADAPVQQAGELTGAARDVLAERQRQISAEGWTPEHDDEHSWGEMARAGAAYAAQSLAADDPELTCGPPPWWPRDWTWKPSSRRRMLVKGAAMIVAEIERIDRAALKGEQPAQPSGSERGNAA